MNPLVFHFLTHHSKEASKWPLYTELRRLNGGDGIEVFADCVPLSYGHRWQLMVFGWPKLVFSSLKLALLSVRHRSRPEFVIVEEHIQFWCVFLVWSLCSLFCWTKKPRFVYLGFIFTSRKSAVLNMFRMFYFRLLFHLVNDVINYSDYERDHLSELFQGCRARFSSIHYGIGDHETTRKHADEMRLSTHLKPRKEELGLLSAGRSCRDYATLFESMRALQTPIDCTVICDSYTELPVTLWNPAIVVLRSCYGQEYTRCIIESDVVVVPLRDSMVSAGQMVALHALAAGKPVIISDTPITREYFGNCGSVHFVKLADSNSLTKSICMLEKQLLFKEQFFEQSRSFFEANFAINRFAFRLFNSIVESM